MKIFCYVTQNFHISIYTKPQKDLALRVIVGERGLPVCYGFVTKGRGGDKKFKYLRYVIKERSHTSVISIRITSVAYAGYLLHVEVIWAIQKLPEVMTWRSTLSTGVYSTVFSIGMTSGSTSDQR